MPNRLPNATPILALTQKTGVFRDGKRVTELTLPIVVLSDTRFMRHVVGSAMLWAHRKGDV